MQLQTLGALRLGDSDFRRPKPLLLLAYLSLEGAKARRYLADLFFMDTADPRNSLDRALSYLRTEALMTIESDEQKIWTTLSCDAVMFINYADQKQLEKALELYRGPFLESLDLPLGGELEEWVYGTREYLAGRFRNVLLQLAEQEANKGNLTQASKYAETAYTLTGAPELEPDDIKRLYTFLQAGKSTLASKLKQEATDFDIDLSHADLALREVRETIRHNLPIRATSFVGRDLELVEINRQLANPDIRLLTLHGTGGIGKSRLAVQAAYDQLQQTRGDSHLSRDGIFFVPLDALASADLIPASIAEAVGLELQGQDDTLSQVTRFIGQKHVLLLLDNYEHLMAGATLPSKLLSTCPNLKLLVTSRERLNLEEEWVMTLEGLSVPSQDTRTFEEAQRFEALNLFVQRAKRARLDFTLSQDDLPHALKICQLVEGSPLGIELAAVWVKMMPLAEISNEIESNLSFLTTTSRNVSHRHQSIKAAFEHSWKLLTDKEQEVLRKLSVFVGGFRREAASEVAGATLPILASLVDKSLLRVSENQRYNQHPLVYQFVREKLSMNSQSEAITLENHTLYYLAFAEELESKFGIYEEKKLRQGIEAEQSNILATWIRLLSQDGLTYLDRLDAFTYLLYLVYEVKGIFEEGEVVFHHAVEAISNVKSFKHSTTMAIMMIGEAWFRYRQGKNASEQAQYVYEILISAPKTKYVKLATFSALNILAKQPRDTGDYETAKRYHEEALAHLDNIDHPIVSTGKIVSLYHLGLLEIFLGNYTAGFSYFQESLVVASNAKSDSNLARCLLNLGGAYLLIGKPEKGRSFLEKSFQLAREAGLISLLHRDQILPLLSLCYSELHQHQKAESLGKEALNVAQEVGDLRGEGWSRAVLGKIAMEQNNYPLAYEQLTKGLTLCWSQKDVMFMPQVFTWFAELQARQGNIVKAIALLTWLSNQPRISQPSKDRSSQVIEKLRSKISPEEAIKALEQGNTMTFQDIFNEVFSPRFLKESLES